MTVEDLLAEAEIRRTIADYTMAGDAQRKDDAAALFTEDGVLRVGGHVVTGRDAIAQLLKAGAAARAAATGTEPMVRHNLMTSRIVLDGEEASARTYYMVVDEGGPSHQGCYIDRFRRVDGRWLIADREVTVDWKR